MTWYLLKFLQEHFRIEKDKTHYNSRFYISYKVSVFQLHLRERLPVLLLASNCFAEAVAYLLQLFCFCTHELIDHYTAGINLEEKSTSTQSHKREMSQQSLANTE